MKQLSEKETAILLVFAALLLGGWARFMPALTANFPLNDGGMFYSMILDLRANHFALPQFTSYNLANIPYAYPPLGFYLAALFGADPLPVLTFLPPTLSTLAILAFFWFARQFFADSWTKPALATVAFALIPRSYSWFVMGGGLTRTLGQIFLLLFLASLWRVYRNNAPREKWLAGLFGGLVVLSHPEATIHAATAAALFWLFFARTRTGFVVSVQVALLTLLFSAPWWGAVLWMHGIEPFFNALQTGGHAPWSAFSVLAFTFAEEPLASLVTVLGLLGMVFALARRDYFLTVWLVAHFVTQPRSATAVAIYPLVLLSALALVDVILPALQKWTAPEVNFSLTRKPVLLAVAGLVIYLALGATIYSAGLALYFVAPEERLAMDWVAQNTPQQARFLVLSAAPEGAMTHSNAEWFPALARRQSVLTLQGSEWTRGDSFVLSMQSAGEVHACLYAGLDCLQARQQSLSVAYDYLYLPLLGGAVSPLEGAIRTSAEYVAVYENAGAAIFQKK
jgi:hypothetical protein